MTRRQKLEAMRLIKYQSGVETILKNTLKAGIVNIRSSLAAKLAELGNAATNSKSREMAIQAAVDAIERMQGAMSAHLTRLVDVSARSAHKGATEELRGVGKQRLVRYDPARTERYMAYLAPRNAKRLAAVFTDKMQDNLVRTLRFGYIDVARRAAVEGLTYAEMNKELQDRWQRDSGNPSLYRFVDRSGRAWENARYFQMLVRTNSQRVWVDSYADSLALNGFQLARISDDGDPDCPVCAAWEGRIICIAGNRRGFPTYADAQEAGVFHPNCTHRLQYIDEALDSEEIALQARHPPYDFSPTAMQESKDEVDVEREMESGKNTDAAKAEVSASRLERHIRYALFSDKLSTFVRHIPQKTLVKMFETGVPRFTIAKKEDKPWAIRHGVLFVPRDATPEQLNEKLLSMVEQAKPSTPSAKPIPTPTEIAVASASLARNDIKTRMKASGFDPSFADALPDGAAILLAHVGVEKLKKAAKYFPSTKSVGIDPDDWWYGHKSTFHHEMGHAFADATGVNRIGTQENTLVTDAMAIDSEAVFAKLPEIFGKNWKRKSANNKKFDVNALSVYLFEKPFQSIDPEKKIILGRISDSICAVTGGKYGYGHSKKYWSSMGPGIFADEMTANGMAAICARDDKFKLFFGKSVEALERIIKSALDKEAEKVAK